MSLIKVALTQSGFVPTEKESTESDEYNDVQITYKGEEYYGSSLVSMDRAYQDLLEDVPEELCDRIKEKLGTL